MHQGDGQTPEREILGSRKLGRFINRLGRRNPNQPGPITAQPLPEQSVVSPAQLELEAARAYTARQEAASPSSQEARTPAQQTDVSLFPSAGPVQRSQAPTVLPKTGQTFLMTMMTQESEIVDWRFNEDLRPQIVGLHPDEDWRTAFKLIRPNVFETTSIPPARDAFEPASALPSPKHEPGPTLRRGENITTDAFDEIAKRQQRQQPSYLPYEGNFIGYLVDAKPNTAKNAQRADVEDSWIITVNGNEGTRQSNNKKQTTFQLNNVSAETRKTLKNMKQARAGQNIFITVHADGVVNFPAKGLVSQLIISPENPTSKAPEQQPAAARVRSEGVPGPSDTRTMLSLQSQQPAERVELDDTASTNIPGRPIPTAYKREVVPNAEPPTVLEVIGKDDYSDVTEEITGTILQRAQQDKFGNDWDVTIEPKPNGTGKTAVRNRTYNIEGILPDELRANLAKSNELPMLLSLTKDQTANRFNVEIQPRDLQYLKSEQFDKRIQGLDDDKLATEYEELKFVRAESWQRTAIRQELYFRKHPDMRPQETEQPELQVQPRPPAQGMTQRQSLPVSAQLVVLEAGPKGTGKTVDRIGRPPSPGREGRL
jgi:hypothetical protein